MSTDRRAQTGCPHSMRTGTSSHRAASRVRAGTFGADRDRIAARAGYGPAEAAGGSSPVGCGPGEPLGLTSVGAIPPV
jgi:hypothetical protein